MIVPLILFLLARDAISQITRDSLWLHITSWPTHTEISLRTPHQASDDSPLLTPRIVKIPRDTSVLPIYLHKPGYRDTLIQLRIRPHYPRNYLFIRMQVESDSLRLDMQKSFARQRHLHRIGRYLTWASLFPALCAAGWAWKAQNAYDQAAQYRDRANQSLLKSSEQWKTWRDQWSSYRHSGERDLYLARIGMLTSLTLLSTGIVLQF